MSSHKPRSGSMQIWPRVRAKRIYARKRSWPVVKTLGSVGFAGYKVGMAHASCINTALKKDNELSLPVTIIECPPLKVMGINFYSKYNHTISLSSTILSKQLDKVLQRKISMPKNLKNSIETVNMEDVVDIRLLVHTQPGLTTVGKKRPEIFELGLGGSRDEKLNFAKEKLGKDIKVSEVFKNGQQLDITGVTKGKGTQGPVKRFGVAIRQHKAEKTKRGPASLGGWGQNPCSMYNAAFAGKMGYHQRTEHNKMVLKVCEAKIDINRKGGFKHYGIVKNDYIILHGSVIGPSRRLLTLCQGSRIDTQKKPFEVQEIIL